MEGERVKCPYCSELIIIDAKKCRFCGEWFIEKKKPEVNGNIKIIHPLREASDQRPKPKPQRKIEKPSYDLSDDNIKKPGVIPLGRNRRINWSRLMFSIVYIGIIVAFVVYEMNAQKVLTNGHELEKVEKLQEARDEYLKVTNDYRLSFAVIGAQSDLERIQAQLEDKVSIDSVYWLPFVTWPVCSVLLFLIFVTRIHRAGIAFLAFLLLLLGIFGSVLQLSWYGLISIKPLEGVIQQFEKEPMGIFFASYLLLIVTAIMTLTATRRFPFGHYILEAKKNGG
jgi:hypothetical protein